MTDIPVMVTASDLVGLPGAPFNDSMVSATVAKIRTLCGWHVAPSLTETMTLDGDGGHEQWLPTRHVSAVTAVQVWDGTQYVDMPDWSADVGWSAAGILSCRHRFPGGRRTVKVTLTHGFDPVPDDLKLLVAVSTGRQVVQEAISSRTMTFSDSDAYGASAILDSYRLGPRP